MHNEFYNVMKEQSNIQAARIRRLTEQLYREYSNLIWYYNLPLKAPVIVISDSRSRHGSWNSVTRVLEISLLLVQKYSWDVVVEILKHEMAHQYVTDVDHCYDETSHGPKFQKACDKFGLADWARAATGEIPLEIPSLRDRLSKNANSHQAMTRIEKLLALAQSANEHEAYAAMQKARALQIKYNLEHISHTSGCSDYESLTIQRKSNVIDSVEARIFSLLKAHFLVDIIYVPSFDAQSLKSVKTVEIMGTPQNLLMAEHVYHFLKYQCDHLWKQYKFLHQAPQSMKRSYKLGLIDGFSKKLESDSKKIKVEVHGQETEVDGRSLMVLTEQQIEQFKQNRFPRTRSISRSTSGVSRFAYSAGVEEGGKITLNRPLSTGKSGFGGFLGRG
jgi:hypothetical protein